MSAYSSIYSETKVEDYEAKNKTCWHQIKIREKVAASISNWSHYQVPWQTRTGLVGYRLLNNVLTDLNFVYSEFTEYFHFSIIYIIIYHDTLKKIAFDACINQGLLVMTVWVRHCQSCTISFLAALFLWIKNKNNQFILGTQLKHVHDNVLLVTEELPWQTDMFHFSF